MNDFLHFIDELTDHFPVHLEIYYSKIMDWCITVYKQGCAEDYPDSPKNENDDAILCEVQDCDMELAFAKAHVAVKEWLCKFNDGY